MSSMNIRQATPEDASVIAEKRLIPLTDSRESFWLLEDDNDQALAFGWAGACKLPVDNLESKAGQIKRAYVHPDHQGKQLGSLLIRRMIAWLGDEGYGPLYIGVWSESHGAQRLYARFGFEKISEYDFPVGEHVDREFILKQQRQ
ncbi:MAG: acetyltransferase [Linnemannia elongata]|nr:MAG: acetyltransferase [Linnemannia elongata]